MGSEWMGSTIRIACSSVKRWRLNRYYFLPAQPDVIQAAGPGWRV